ncbi:MAG TPA: hypothetical protein VJI15_05115 [Candidatus Nanoarchaeia archaeon]|nr:hypothetical protein [Candidatus Nanoarchaeia archaeon]
MTKRVILYVEDDPISIYYARLNVQQHFPDREFCSFRSGDSLEDAITSGSVAVRDIGIICADETLLARQNNEPSYGWQAVEFLRSQGYRGRALDISTFSMPSEKSHLFIARCPKFGKEFIAALRKYLPTE